jgi:hypothetical protein
MCKGKKVSYLVNESKLKWNSHIYNSKAWYIVCVCGQVILRCNCGIVN